MTARKILTIVGARPQFIKAAAISRAMAAQPALSESIVHTGQHFDSNMSDVFFEELDIPAPARHLGISGGGHGDMTGRMLAGLERILVEDRPDAVLVYGDTNSTLAGALAAVKLHIPLIHVEAGLRSFNKAMPEEVNRVVTDHVSDLLLCPTERSIANLERESVRGRVVWVGDVMFDAALFAKAQAARRANILDQLGLTDGGFALCTLHRAENTDNPERFRAALEFVEANAGDMQVVFPVHPRTRKLLEGHQGLLKRMTPIEPVGYLDMHLLLAHCALVMTDSGGVQKEAYFHRRPCITLRDETEWVETVEAGWNRLWTSPDWIAPRKDIDDYGRGLASEACVAAILDYLG